MSPPRPESFRGSAGTAGGDGPGTVSAKESSLILERGLNLLQAVADADSDAPTISELATTVGVSRAAVYRLLGPLRARGLVRREGSRVRLGTGELYSGAHGMAAPVRGIPGLRESVGVMALEPVNAHEIGPLVVETATSVAEALS